MTIRYFPFNSKKGDRKYAAEDFRKHQEALYTSGILGNESNNLQVRSNDDMTIKINPGFAVLEGATLINNNDYNLSIDIADSVVSRIDRVVLQLNHVERVIKPYIKKGQYSQNPTPPSLTRNADMYEICLAEINVNKGAVKITQADIRDTRHIDSLCGIASFRGKPINVEDIYIQYEDELKGIVFTFQTSTGEKEEEMNKLLEEFKSYTDEQREEIASVLEDLNEMIEEENVAGQLISMINKKADKDDVSRIYKKDIGVRKEFLKELNIEEDIVERRQQMNDLKLKTGSSIVNTRISPELTGGAEVNPSLNIEEINRIKGGREVPINPITDSRAVNHGDGTVHNELVFLDKQYSELKSTYAFNYLPHISEWSAVGFDYEKDKNLAIIQLGADRFARFEWTGNKGYLEKGKYIMIVHADFGKTVKGAHNIILHLAGGGTFYIKGSYMDKHNEKKIFVGLTELKERTELTYARLYFQAQLYQGQNIPFYNIALMRVDDLIDDSMVGEVSYKTQEELNDMLLYLRRKDFNQGFIDLSFTRYNYNIKTQKDILEMREMLALRGLSR